MPKNALPQAHMAQLQIQETSCKIKVYPTCSAHGGEGGWGGGGGKGSYLGRPWQGDPQQQQSVGQWWHVDEMPAAAPGPECAPQLPLHLPSSELAHWPATCTQLAVRTWSLLSQTTQYQKIVATSSHARCAGHVQCHVGAILLLLIDQLQYAHRSIELVAF